MAQGAVVNSFGEDHETNSERKAWPFLPLHSS